VPQLAILPGGAMYNINPDQDIIIVEITREKLVKLLRLNFFVSGAILRKSIEK